MSNIFKSEKEIAKIKNSKEFKKAVGDKNINDFVNNKQFKEFKDKYEGKSEDEILNDARNMGKKLKEQYGEQEYNKKIADLKNFERFLNPEQKKKLRKFIEGLD